MKKHLFNKFLLIFLPAITIPPITSCKKHQQEKALVESRLAKIEKGKLKKAQPEQKEKLQEKIEAKVEEKYANPKNKPWFATSLHKTTEGMRYWYEEEGGFGMVTKIPYNKLGCKNCHTESCASCHGETIKEGEKQRVLYSLEHAQKNETCLKCHLRAKKTFAMDKDKNSVDIHISAGLGCYNCHSGGDVHGYEKEVHSMRDEGAVKADCMNCHLEKSEDAPKFDTRVPEHKQHAQNIHCNACHVSSSLACVNCHFSKFIETKKKKGNFMVTKDWLFLINYEGKVTSATAMTLVYNDEKFIVYAPYFTHSVTTRGRKCNDCHGTKEMKTLAMGKKIKMISYKNNEIKFAKGLFPIIPDKLEWMFFDKKNGKWVPLKKGKKPGIQMVGYGEAITKDQIKKLAKPR